MPTPLPKWSDDPSYKTITEKLAILETDWPKFQRAFERASQHHAAAQAAAGRVEGKALIGKASSKDLEQAREKALDAKRAMEQARDEMETAEAQLALARATVPEVEAVAKEACARAIRIELLQRAEHKSKALAEAVRAEAAVDEAAAALTDQFGQYLFAPSGNYAALTLREVPYRSDILRLAFTVANAEKFAAWLKDYDEIRKLGDAPPRPRL